MLYNLQREAKNRSKIKESSFLTSGLGAWSAFPMSMVKGSWWVPWQSFCFFLWWTLWQFLVLLWVSWQSFGFFCGERCGTVQSFCSCFASCNHWPALSPGGGIAVPGISTGVWETVHYPGLSCLVHRVLVRGKLSFLLFITLDILAWG